MKSSEDEQHFLQDTIIIVEKKMETLLVRLPSYAAIREQHHFLFDHSTASIRLLLKRSAD